MQAVVLIGFALYYAAVAATLHWLLRRYSLWFTSFLAVVIGQAILFGGDYLYFDYWESWNSIALVTSSAICIPIVVMVALIFKSRRFKLTSARN